MVVILDTPCSEVQCKTTGYPFHSHVSPSLPLPCVTVCHQVSTELYLLTRVCGNDTQDPKVTALLTASKLYYPRMQCVRAISYYINSGIWLVTHLVNCRANKVINYIYTRQILLIRPTNEENFSYKSVRNLVFS